MGEYLPAGSARNLAELEVADGATLDDVLQQLNMPSDGAYLIAINGEVVPIGEWADRRLAEDDKLSIMSPLKGG